MSGVTVRCLSFHATYRCRHSGDCCTARWPIPIEPDALARDHRVRGRLADCGIVLDTYKDHVIFERQEIFADQYQV